MASAAPRRKIKLRPKDFEVRPSSLAAPPGARDLARPRATLTRLSSVVASPPPSPSPAQSDAYLRKLEGITVRLSSAFPAAPPMDRQDVAKLVMELMQGHEETLGAHSPAPRAMVKLPARHWRDFAPGGALFAILRRCLREKHAKSLRRFDWQSDHKRLEFVEMMRQCGDDLREKGLERRVVVCFAPDVPRESRAALRASVLAMRAVLATSPADDGVTHILHAPIPSAAAPSAASPEDAPGSTAQRPTISAADKPKALGVVGKEALVRLRRHPSSYDHWVALSGIAREAYAEGSVFDAEPPEVDEADDHLGLRARADRASSGPTRVTTEWLTDSEAFNEWCDEREYAWEDPAEKAARVLREATEARERVDARAQEAAASEGLLPGSRKRPREDADGAVPEGGEGEDARLPGTAAPLATTAAEETVAPARLAERLAPNLVKRQMVAPHRAVFVAAAGDAGEGGPDAAATPFPGTGFPGDANVAVENISRGQRPDAARERRDVDALVANAAERLPEETTKGSTEGSLENTDDAPGDDDRPASPPGYAAWFARGAAPHEVERLGVPEFFAEKGAEELGDARDARDAYVLARDAMLAVADAAASRGRACAFPEAARAAREALATDARFGTQVRFSSASTLQRVFDFLERWGLANHPRALANRAPWSVAGLETPGSTRAAAAALYAFAAAPATGAEAFAASAAGGTRTNGLGSVGSNPESVPPERAPRLGRPPKNPAVIAAREAAEAERAGLAAAGRGDAANGGGGGAGRCFSCGDRLEPREGNPAYFELATPARGPGGSLFTSAALEGVRAGGSEPSGSAATRLCGVCFFDGKLPDGASSASFARIRGEPEQTLNKPASGFGRVDGERREEEEEEEEAEEDLWTDQETLALFEALEAHGRDDWTAVANRVGTKTAEQCVKRFVRFPVEDAFVEDLAAGAGGAGAKRSAAPPFGLLSDAADAPFADAANPVMSLVAFLATCVGPRVAAAAARAALRTLAELSGEGDEEENGEVPAGGEEEGAKNGVSEKGSALWAKTPAPAVSREHERAAAAAGLAAAAVKAKLLADRDEHEIEKLVVGVVEMQMRKIELKLRQCEELDAGLTREREALERQTARANAERKAAKRAAEEEAKRLAAFRAQAEADAAAIAAKRAETEAARKAAEEARIASVPPEPRGGE